MLKTTCSIEKCEKRFFVGSDKMLSKFHFIKELNDIYSIYSDYLLLVFLKFHNPSFYSIKKFMLKVKDFQKRGYSRG